MAAPRALSQSEKQAFFSIDASFAFLAALFSFALFSTALLFAASAAASQSKQAELDNLALRLSSYALDKSASGDGEYGLVNEVDLQKFDALQYGPVPPSPGASYIRLTVSGGRMAPRSAEYGVSGGEVHCARRLALVEGDFAILEACIS